MASLAAPTPEHFLPLLYVLAQQGPDDDADVPIQGIENSTLSMLCTRVNQRTF
jgi:4,5-DOPA dioxygenase extradiol